ncbi:DUF4435 domain-containing protein [Marinobacter arenosus]|uniref:DUF4435 domain-containing protein n=1 Tax=Marinobacter arenosus TaxID=2856822 RepID=UPI001C4ABF6D|nr:DUF4435 domain-containing protein [Marinobacter arenosus]MBW0147512.1 DUF4435 domain-containing protein [Marinobacter arenosus]
MSGLRYSSAALNVLNEFYDKEYVVYVEGEDDIVFWESVFHNLGFKSVQVEQKFGSGQIDDYQDSVVNENAKIIICRDADYLRFDGQECKHPRVIYTAGHSIENSIIDIGSLSKMVLHLGRCSRNELNEIQEELQDWLENFFDEIEELIELEIAANRFRKGVKILGENCARFMKTPQSAEVCEEKLKLFIREVKNKFNQDEIRQAKELIRDSNMDSMDIVRGHFLLSATIRVINSQIKKRRKKVSVKAEDIFSSCMQNFESHFSSHRHKEHYDSAVTEATKSLA